MRFNTMMIGSALLAIAAPLAPANAERIFGLTGADTIVTFNSNNPSTILSTGAITGLAAGSRLIGLDIRPGNRTLYTMSTFGILYTLTASGGGYIADQIGDINTKITGTNFGFDFNPVADRLRFTSISNQNLRINPNEGSVAAITDGAINFPGSPGVNPDVIGAAYTNNLPGLGSTVLYGLDATTDSLVRFTSPNAGTIVGVGALGLTVTPTSRIGFDISGLTGVAYLSRNDGLFTVNLSTGLATFIGAIGGPAEQIRDITAAAIPEPGTWAMMLGGFGLVGGAMRLRSSRLRTVTA